VQRSTFARLGIPSALLLVSGTLLTTVAAASDAGATAPKHGVTVLLPAKSEGTLRHLAHARGLDRVSRVAAARQAAPAMADRRVAVHLAQQSGVDVTDQNVFSMHVTGSSLELDSFEQQLRATQPSAVVLADDSGPAWRPLDQTIDGPTAKQIYDAPDGVSSSGSQPVIATVQLSGWNSADLSAYASSIGIPDPVSSGQYTAVSVASANPTQPDGTGGDGEVALDQEALLAAAPHLGQRAYFVPNYGAVSIIEALDQIATDAMNSAHNYYNLAAVSISWGGCEAETSPSAVGALHQALVNTLAAGVTVFAASGDWGAYDCPDPTSGPSVDLPAADPLVVGVGGTTLQSAGTAPEETGWFDPADGSGSGGGVSTIWDQPTYQRGHVVATGRAVPDIAMDADPNTGFAMEYGGQSWQVGGTSLASPMAAGTFGDLLASNGFDGGIGNILPNLYAAPTTSFRDVTTGSNGLYLAKAGYDEVTGLGAPLWNHLASSLVGNPTLHAPAYSNSRTIPVHLTWPQGMSYSAWEKGTGTEPTYCGTTATSSSAPTTVHAPSDGRSHVWVSGDTASGWCYSDSASVFVDTVQPHAKLSVSSAKGRLHVSWSIGDAKPSSGLTPRTVTVKILGQSRPVVQKTTTTRSLSVHLRHGVTYAVSLKVRDVAGNIRTVHQRFSS
jgi:hypothetical protein